MRFLKKLFQKKQTDFFRLENCEFEKDERDYGDWIEYEFNIRNKEFGWLGRIHTDIGTSPYFNIINLMVGFSYINVNGEMSSTKLIHGHTNLKPGRIFWFNQNKGEITNVEEWQWHSVKSGSQYAFPTTIVFEESDCYKAKFKENRFVCQIKSDCFQELIKLIERDDIDNFHISFTNEIKPSQNDMWHYSDFAKNNKLQLPTESMWGISEENEWEAIPFLSFESKKIKINKQI